MEGSFKGAFTIGTLFLAAYVIGSFDGAHGAGEKNPCSPSSPDNEAMTLFPCLGPSKDASAKVSPGCCSAVEKIIARKNKSCMCAVMTSDMAKNAGVNVSIAITIPMRCNNANRPVGSKCEGYVVP